MKTILKQSIFVIALLMNTAVMAQTENSAVIAIDNMNVLYVGVDNPISIAVPNVASNRLKVSIDNGSISGVNGKYIVKVSTGTEATISVAAEVKPGEISQLGSMRCRIKRIPEPVAYVSGIATIDYYSITKNELMQNPVINVMVNVPFELPFTVISFSFSYTSGTELIKMNATGNRLNEKMIEAVKSFENGKKFHLEDIKVSGPDGITRTIAAINVTIRE